MLGLLLLLYVKLEILKVKKSPKFIKHNNPKLGASDEILRETLPTHIILNKNYLNLVNLANYPNSSQITPSSFGERN